MHISGHEGNLDIIDILDKFIISTHETEASFTIVISTLQAGVYLLRSGEKISRFSKN